MGPAMELSMRAPLSRNVPRSPYVLKYCTSGGNTNPEMELPAMLMPDAAARYRTKCWLTTIVLSLRTLIPAPYTTPSRRVRCKVSLAKKQAHTARHPKTHPASVIFQVSVYLATMLAKRPESM